ncbi:hypothetical protein PO909_032544 [Leuciscus waleckii]
MNESLTGLERQEGRANHWSALIGASHSKNYILWEYGGYASDGVKQVAELGSPVKMEEEIRQKVLLAQATRGSQMDCKILHFLTEQLLFSPLLDKNKVPPEIKMIAMLVSSTIAALTVSENGRFIFCLMYNNLDNNHHLDRVRYNKLVLIVDKSKMTA